MSDRVTEYLDDIVGTEGVPYSARLHWLRWPTRLPERLALSRSHSSDKSLGRWHRNHEHHACLRCRRTKEIGIRKALGQVSVIRGQFIVEALTLTILGGLLGVIRIAAQLCGDQPDGLVVAFYPTPRSYLQWAFPCLSVSFSGGILR